MWLRVYERERLSVSEHSMIPCGAQWSVCTCMCTCAYNVHVHIMYMYVYIHVCVYVHVYSVHVYTCACVYTVFHTILCRILYRPCL